MVIGQAWPGTSKTTRMSSIRGRATTRRTASTMRYGWELLEYFGSAYERKKAELQLVALLYERRRRRSLRTPCLNIHGGSGSLRHLLLCHLDPHFGLFARIKTYSTTKRPFSSLIFRSSLSSVSPDRIEPERDRGVIWTKVL